MGARRPLSHMQAGSRQGGWACGASRASWVTLSFACERLNLLSFSSPERSFWDAGLWAELCVCSPLMPEPPTHCDVVRVSDSGPGAFQFAGSGIPFQGILCHVAWKQVEMGQLRTTWGSRASWGHWMGTRLPGPLAVPAFP